MATPKHYKAQTSEKTQAVDSWIREEAQKLIDKQKKSLTPSQRKKLEHVSQKLKALALLSDHKIQPGNHCKICSCKGYIMIRGDKKENKEYAWEQEACYCTWHKVSPTDVANLIYIEREPAKQDAPVPKAKRAKSPKPAKDSGSSKSPRKRPAKV